MKKLLFIVFIATMSFGARAQKNVTISGGVKMIGAEASTMQLWYVDESPSRDNIYKDIYPIGKIAGNFSVRWTDNDSGRPFRLFLEGQGYIGGIWGAAFSGGYIYHGSSEGSIRIQPEISAVLGYCSKGLGMIENNDVYIQVNNTKFQDYTDVSVALRNAYIGIRPGLSFVFKAGVEREIGIGVNYQLSYKAGFLSFSGADNNGAQANETEYLTAKNVGFYVNGYKSGNNPYNPDGLEFKVFYSF
jgi:hypothetical protein